MRQYLGILLALAFLAQNGHANNPTDEEVLSYSPIISLELTGESIEFSSFATTGNWRVQVQHAEKIIEQLVVNFDTEDDACASQADSCRDLVELQKAITNDPNFFKANKMNPENVGEMSLPEFAMFVLRMNNAIMAKSL
ncbi:MAG: hypothetical protein R3A80_09100 [Bdellovibrionota bacterium]